VNFGALCWGPDDYPDQEHKHEKVFPESALSAPPYLWVCRSCLATGEETEMPIFRTEAFNRLWERSMGRTTGDAPAKGPPKCYDCGKLVGRRIEEWDIPRCQNCSAPK